MSILKLVISHNIAEKKLAEAWQKLIESVSLKAVEVWFSSDTNPLGGMKIGEEWREDLYQRLRECDFVLALQTPMSASKPWIMWECGVASGVGRERGIIPIVYEMDRGGLSNPLNSYEAYRGDDSKQVQEVCERLVQKAGLVPGRSHYVKAIKAYMNTVQLHLSHKFVPAVAVNTTLWINRIDTLIQSGRIGELKSRRQQMYASLGKPPLDPVIHDLLGQLLLQQRDFQEALEETEYGLALTPGDIPLLHRKALALVGLHNLDAAKKIIDRIVAQNQNLKVDTEIATLLGRIYREQWQNSHNPADLDKSIDSYFQAFQSDPDSYYAGVNVIGPAIIKGDITLATRIANEVLALCEQEQKQQKVSFWVDFTAGEVYLALGNVEKAKQEYEKGVSRTPKPEAFEYDSAAKGAARMIAAKKLPDEVLDEIRAILR